MISLATCKGILLVSHEVVLFIFYHFKVIIMMSLICLVWVEDCDFGVFGLGHFSSKFISLPCDVIMKCICKSFFIYALIFNSRIITNCVAMEKNNH